MVFLSLCKEMQGCCYSIQLLFSINTAFFKIFTYHDLLPAFHFIRSCSYLFYGISVIICSEILWTYTYTQKYVYMLYWPLYQEVKWQISIHHYGTFLTVWNAQNIYHHQCIVDRSEYFLQFFKWIGSKYSFVSQVLQCSSEHPTISTRRVAMSI
jgi:hypothetical protein